jgi:hypothetical protein
VHTCAVLVMKVLAVITSVGPKMAMAPPYDDTPCVGCAMYTVSYAALLSKRHALIVSSAPSLGSATHSGACVGQRHWNAAMAPPEPYAPTTDSGGAAVADE